MNMWMSVEVKIALCGVFLAFMFMWYKGKLPTTGELQDLTTILNSRGGNILILAIASVYFFHRAEIMYYAVVEMIKAGTIGADNGIALNGLTFDTGAFGSAFGALLKTMSPDAPSPLSSASSATVTTTKTTTHPPDKKMPDGIIDSTQIPTTGPTDPAVAADSAVDSSYSVKLRS